MGSMIKSIIKFIEMIPLIGRIFSACYGIWLLCKKDIRLIQNLKRPIMVMDSSTKDMKLVRELIHDAGFFRLEEPTTATQSTDRIRNHGAIIVGYTKGESNLKEIISAAKNKSIPVIVFAMPGELEAGSQDLKSVQEYSYAEIAKTPFRLVNLIFAILSTHRYGR